MLYLTMIQILRLLPSQAPLAKQMFVLMAQVFEHPASLLTEDYVQGLLEQPNFWALAAVQGDQVVGGLTAHVLPMTHHMGSELFIYDLAVHPQHQRQGVGRALVQTLVQQAKDQGIADVFVPADNDDTHALDFYRALGGRPSDVTIFDFGPDE